MKKGKQFFKDNRGMSNIMTLILVMSAIMLITALLVATSIFIKHGVAKKAMQKAITSCEVGNMDLQYKGMIEGESFEQAVNYNTPTYKDTFFSALQENFAHADKTADEDGYTYLIYGKSGSQAFSLQNVSLNIAVEERTMPDGQQQRLTYTAAGTLVIPIEAFNYTANIALPVKVTASFQQIG